MNDELAKVFELLMNRHPPFGWVAMQDSFVTRWTLTCDKGELSLDVELSDEHGNRESFSWYYTPRELA
jgi:hypothetical protein